MSRRGPTVRVLTRRLGHQDGGRRPDDVIVEEPLTIQLDTTVVATTMRTPGNDFELAVGLCFTDGHLAGHPVTGVRYCATGSAVETEFNVVTVATGGKAPAPTPRLSVTSSSCGLCGADAIAELADRITPRVDAGVEIDPEVLCAMPERVRPHQRLFAATGAVHAAAAFDASGALVAVREDIGRHNAVDKVVGRLLLDGRLPASGLGLYVSGRASFEIVAKAWAAGFGAIVAVSAPSALAVEAARAANLVLVGFVRDGEANQYSP